MVKRLTLFLLAVLATPAIAEEAGSPATSKPPEQLHGIISHGDSGDVMEDFFGSRVERPAPEGETSSRKYDPVIRWDDRPIRR